MTSGEYVNNLNTDQKLRGKVENGRNANVKKKKNAVTSLRAGVTKFFPRRVVIHGCAPPPQITGTALFPRTQQKGFAVGKYMVYGPLIITSNLFCYALKRRDRKTDKNMHLKYKGP